MIAVNICCDFGVPQNKDCPCFHCLPICLPWSDGLDVMIFIFWMLSFKPTFSLSSFSFIKRLCSSLSAIRVVSSAYWRLLIFLLAILIPACVLPVQRSLSRVQLFATPWTVRILRILCPWDSPGKNSGVESHSLLQKIFLTQGSNPGLLHCRQILYSLSHQEHIVKDREAWHAAIHGVKKSQTKFSDWTTKTTLARSTLRTVS